LVYYFIQIKQNKRRIENEKNRLLSGIIAFTMSLSLMSFNLCITTSAADTGLTINESQLSPEFVKYQKNVISGFTHNPKDKTGFTPPPFQIPSVKSNLLYASTYPAAYDLRSLGKVTTVKNQGSSGSCWTFATFGSLESILLPAENRDFSENNLKNNSGFDLNPNTGGGNYDMATAYLARWSGPINESDDPYNPASTTSPADKTVQKHIQEVLYIPARAGALDNDGIKSAIMEYGAVGTTMYWTSSCFNDTFDTYYYSSSGSNNHAVTIVGWDDNFDRTKFAGTLPPGNGAFIVKNSWGSSWGEQGYFYISYYDGNIGGYNAVYNGAETTTNYSRVYQYDPLGCTSSIGYMNDSAWFSNVFTASSSEALAAVSFYTPVANSYYEVYVCNNYTNTTSLTSSRVLKGSGIISLPGYHTIKLDSGGNLTAGNKFAVIVKLKTPGSLYPVMIEKKISGYSSAATANAGEGFLSSSGSSWQDLTTVTQNASTSVCLKAFTTASMVTDAEVPTITAQPADKTVNVGGEAILSVGASVTKGNLSYQWYINTLKSNSSGTKITDGTGNNSSYSAPTSSAGTCYYYCVVTNTDDTATGSKTAETTSNAVSVVVNAVTNAETPTITTQPVDKTVK